MFPEDGRRSSEHFKEKYNYEETYDCYARCRSSWASLLFVRPTDDKKTDGKKKKKKQTTEEALSS